MKWEYKVESVKCVWDTALKSKSVIETLCNDLDKEGWELFDVEQVDQGAYYILIFRRER